MYQSLDMHINTHTHGLCVYIYTYIYIIEQFPGNISRIWAIKSNFFSFSFVLSLVSPTHRVLHAQRGLIPGTSVPCTK